MDHWLGLAPSMGQIDMTSYSGASLKQDVDAEVFGMAIGRGQQPEQNLAFHEVAQIGLRLGRAHQHLGNIAHTRTAIGFVLEVRRQAQCLTKILLRQSHPPLAG